MKILLAYDDSPGAVAALLYVLQLRDAGLALSVVLANVQPPPTLYEVVVAHDAAQLDDVRRAAGADLLARAETLLQTAGIEWESEVAGGEPQHLLVDLVENYGCEAVFVGTDAGSDIGGVAQALLRHSPVPVTLIRAAGS